MDPSTVTDILVVGVAFLSFMSTVVMYFWNKKDRTIAEEKNRIYEEIKKGDTKSFQAIDEVKDRVASQDRRLRVLEGQQVSEDKVDKMLRDQVDPVKDDVQRLEDELKERFTIMDTNMYKLLHEVSEVKGYLKAMYGDNGKRN